MQTAERMECDLAWPRCDWDFRRLNLEIRLAGITGRSAEGPE